MVAVSPAMSNTSGAVIAVATVGSVAGCIFLIVVCLCCWRRQREDSYDSADFYVSVPREEGQPQRSDVKQLRKHSWKERVDSRGRSPLLTRKTINLIKAAAGFRFERPADRTFVSENVQPDNYSQTSLNAKLGVPRANYLQPEADGKWPTQHQQQLQQQQPQAAAGQNQTSESPPPGTSASASDGAIANVDPSTIIPDEPPPLLDDSDYSNEKLGKIQFSLKYDFQEMTLTLKVMRAVELPAKDFSGTSDPYVKILLLPDKKHKLQTNIKRRNLNPRWNEVFAFEGFPFSKLQNRTLYMQVLDYDRFSRDDPIGEICLPLGNIDLGTGVTMWRSLQPCKGHTGKLGELLVSMCYQPTVGQITLVIMKGRGLKAKDINGTSDPYVKIWMCHDGKKVEKKKTTIKERDLNPVFNESFIFDVPYEKIRQTSLVISVMDYDRMGRNELIGQVVLGSKSGPMEVRHWNEMFSKSRQPVAQWHILKDFG